MGQIWNKKELDTVKVCPLCGATDNRFLTKRGDNLPIHECTNCGFAFLYKRPSQQALASYYDGDYFQNSDTYQDYFNYAQAIIDLRYCPRLHRLRRFLSDFRGKRVLDLGCAAGGTLALLKTMGAKGMGIEISKAACKIAREHYDLDVICSPLENVTLNRESFDVIFMFDVLEHLEKPSEALNWLHDVLSPNGLLSLTVPNFDLFFKKGKNWAGVQSYWEHLGYFRSNVLYKKLSSMGMEIIETHTYGEEPCSENHIRETKRRKITRRLREKLPVFNKFLRIARKLKFRYLGPPPLDIRYDGTGMDLFVLVQKTYPDQL